MYELEVVSRDLPGEADLTPTTWFGDSRCFSQKRCSDGAVMWRRRIARGAVVAIGAGGALRACGWRPSWRSTSPPAPGSAGKPLDGKLTILSQNLWNSFYVGGPDRQQRLQAFKEYLRRYPVDIVVVQEMFTFGLGFLCEKSEAEEVALFMHELGFYFQTSSTATTPFVGQNSGLVVYSKLPLTAENHGVFQQRRSVSAKGWLQVEVQVGERRLQILTTHLEHAHQPRWRAVRESQWRQVAAIAAASTDLRMLSGDFNVCGQEFGQALDQATEYHSMVSTLAAVGLTQELPDASSLQMPTLRSDKKEELRCSPDHIFVTSALKECNVKALVVDTRGDDGRVVSDHRGLLAEFQL
ncbi:unnamed protein product [Effrenium voratum]|nr:unnamed protein product [Effrenium voratum]